MAVSASFCTNLRRCTILKRAVFAVVAVLLLLSLSAERMEFVQDYAELDGGTVKVAVLDDGLGDIQDNEPYILLDVFPCCRMPLAAETGAHAKFPAVQAIYLPELRPPAFA